MVIDVALGLALVIIGIALLALELAHPGALLFIPGTILLVAGFLYLFFPTTLLDSAVGPVAVIAGAAIATVIEVFYYRWVAPTHKPLSTTVDGLVGEEAVVVAEIIPDTLKGKVRVRTEIWSARAPVRIPVGTRVRVVHGEGVSLGVEEIRPAETAARPAPPP
ncbi:MAG TPA: NfeD family protein [Thermoplasmata archaeon]|nr:NfeD family protein [Thermoplasmata archaeon]